MIQCISEKGYLLCSGFYYFDVLACEFGLNLSYPKLSKHVAEQCTHAPNLLHPHFVEPIEQVLNSPFDRARVYGTRHAANTMSTNDCMKRVDGKIIYGIKLDNMLCVGSNNC